MIDAEIEVFKQILYPLYAPVILQLGAHTGEDCYLLSSLCSHDPRFVMVEPDPRNTRQIMEKLPLRQLIVGAVAAKTELRMFNFTEGGSGSGSLLTPTGHITRFPEITFPYQQEVMCYTLDDIAAMTNLKQIDLMYVDIQGAEKEMIQGGASTLARTKWLFMEAEEVEFYQGQALREELIAMLPEWNLVQSFEYNILLKNKAYD